MADPKRLDPATSPLHRALLSAGDRRFEPPAGAFEAVWGGVATQVAGAAGASGGAAAGGAASSTAPGSAATAATGAGGGAANVGGALLSKWVLVVMVALGATAGAALLTRAAMHDAEPPARPVAAAPPEHATPAPTLEPLPPAPPVLEWNATVAPTTTSTSGDRLPAGGDAFHGGAVSTRPRPSTLPEETATIIRAREDIQRGAPAEAIRVLDAFERDHRGGLLGEERELLRVRALAALGDPRAKTRAAAFVARHPQSSYAERFRPFTQ